MRRFFSALVLALLAATAVAVPAQAHAELKSSNPASGAALDAPPQQVELTFSGVISLPDGDAITITGPDGAKWPITQSAAVDRTITAKFDTAAMKAGAHTLAWKAKSEDGDTVEGTFTFTMNVAAQTSSAAPTSSVPVSAPVSNAAPPASQESGGVPLWVWVLVGLVVVVGAILLVRRRPAN
ncbi:copper resistance CopC family protein [Lentzea sp.]|uniref:copper resistance CopC family protein n=1 Tax=Lentzea sp. TaxID=56099 RepID=UPI002B7874B2|nr:copper resistance CopC family protein [Lentzea sp.]HUQ58953.1 copper resistance CopC family protein [Lentzea sp.]